MNENLVKVGNRKVRTDAKSIEYPKDLLNPYFAETQAAGIYGEKKL